MAIAFVLNRANPAAPFSTLYLFGRAQDVGVQKPIGGSPRKRHHARFWGQSLERAEATLNTPAFCTDRPPLDQPALRVGAVRATPAFRSPGSPSRSPRATDPDANEEREFIVGELKRLGAIGEVRWLRAGDCVEAAAGAIM
jgi:hypothetical protein